jgi:hypothetical protein
MTPSPSAPKAQHSPTLDGATNVFGALRAHRAHSPLQRNWHDLAQSNRSAFTALSKLPGMKSDAHAAMVHALARQMVQRQPTLHEIGYVAKTIDQMPTLLRALNAEKTPGPRADSIAKLRQLTLSSDKTAAVAPHAPAPQTTAPNHAVTLAAMDLTRRFRTLLQAPALLGDDVSKAIQAQQQIGELVQKELAHLGLGVTAIELRKPLSEAQIQRVATTLVVLNDYLPDTAKADPCIRNMMLSMGYHLLLQPQRLSPAGRELALTMGQALDGLALPRCPVSASMTPQLWQQAKAALLPWMQYWSSFLSENANQIQTQTGPAVPLSQLTAASNARLLVMNDATAVGDANAHVGLALAHGTKRPVDPATGIDRGMTFPFVFGQGAPVMKLIHGNMPVSHEIHGAIGMRPLGKQEYSPAYNVLALPLDADLTPQSMTTTFRDDLRGHLPTYFSDAKHALVDLQYNAASRRINFDQLRITAPGADVDPLIRVTALGLVDRNDARGKDVIQFFKSLQTMQGQISPQQGAELIKTYRQSVHPKMTDMSHLSVKEQTVLMNRALAARYLMKQTKWQSFDVTHLERLQKNPPRDLLQMNDAQMEKVLRGLGYKLQGGQVVGDKKFGLF